MSDPTGARAPSEARARRAWRAAAAAVVATLVLVLVTLAVFERAYPLVDVGLRLSREEAIARARTLAAAGGLAPAGARAAARFESDEQLATYVDLAAGGSDSVRALARGRDVSMFTWAVRLFEPGNPRETLVRFDADGRVVGLRRTLAESDRRPTVSEAEGRVAADSALPRWAGGLPASAWRFTAASYTTQQPSQRVDRTYRYTRIGRTVGEAPIRADVVVTGADSARAAGGVEVLGVRTYVDVPESWTRRYGEMRASNDLYAQLSLPGMLVFLAGAVIALVKLRDAVRWRPAMLVGGTIGGLMLLGALNALPLAWFGYDTATPTTSFIALAVLGAIGAGVAITLFVGGAVAAAEVLTRRAFPRQLDWYGYVRHRGSGEVAAHVLGGYALAALGFAYVSLFYLTTRRVLGWWVPTGSLDDPNQIATPLPWVSAIGTALFAGVWEEAIFRAVPLALLSLWVGTRPSRTWWMAAGVVVTALVFGFGHANYPSWPAYARGVELFLEASLWAVLYLTVGLPVTIVAHVLYDLAWFGLFALHGDGAAYRTTAAVVIGAGLLPALLVAQGALARRRARAAAALPERPATFADWRPASVAAAVDDAPPEPVVVDRAGTRRRAAALALAAAAALSALVRPPRAPFGPDFTAPRARVAAVADSALRAAGADPARWTRTMTVRGAGVEGELRRFLRDSLGSRARAVAALQRLATSYAPGPVWEARYVRRAGTLRERAESWRVFVQPDGRVRKVAHQLPDDASGDSLTAERARAAAGAALRARGVDPSGLREVGVTLVPRPRRVDAVVEWEDPAVALPGGARARLRTDVVGRELVDVRRDVKLPEAVERANRERASRRLTFAAGGGLLALGLAIGLAMRALRRAPREELPAGRARLGRRGALLVGTASALVTLATQVNGFEGTLTDWPTDQPWSVFLSGAILSGLLAAVMFGAVIAGGWSLLDALRRRAALPWVPTGPDGVREAAVAGLGLAGAPTLLALLADRVRPDAWPAMPATVLGERLPWLAQALTGASAMLLQPLGLIAVLGLLLALRRPWARAAALAAMALCLVPALMDDRGPLSTALVALAGVAGVAALVWAFGRGSVLAWVFAGGSGAMLGGLRGLRDAATAADRIAAIVAVAVSALLVWLVWRRHGAMPQQPLDQEEARDSPLPAASTG
ncbi:MAG: CPBP family glutamic-type intramembrane protease [Gemmatirosa sp.]